MWKSPYAFGGLFAVFGLPFAALGLLLIQHAWQFGTTAVETQGVVLRHAKRVADRGTTYAPVVWFSDQGGGAHRFTSEVGASRPRYREGERVPVLYDPGAPGEAVIDGWSRYAGGAMFLFLGSVFLAIGGVLLIRPVRKALMIARLRRRGVARPAKLLEVFRDTGLRINGRTPWRVAVQTRNPASGRLKRFESEPVWVDPTDALAGQSPFVLFDPRRPKNFHVDLAPFVDEDSR